MMQINYVPSEEIDIAKYNGCVHYSPNGNIYGLEWYLKNTYRMFDILVEDDYSSVMALPFSISRNGKKKMYIHPLSGQTSIYSVNMLSPSRISAFFRAIPKEFSTVEMLSHMPNTCSSVPNYICQQHHVGILNLEKPYHEIRGAYKARTIQFLEKEIDEYEIYAAQLSVEEMIEAFVGFTKLNGWTYPLYRLIYNAKHRGIGFPMAYVDGLGNPLVIAYFLYDKNSVYNLILGSVAGDQVLQTYLLDSFIRQHAERSLNLNMHHISSKLSTSLGAALSPYMYLRKKSTFSRFLDKLGI